MTEEIIPVWMTTKRKRLNHINLQDDSEFEADRIILEEEYGII